MEHIVPLLDTVRSMVDDAGRLPPGEHRQAALIFLVAYDQLHSLRTDLARYRLEQQQQQQKRLAAVPLALPGGGPRFDA